MSKDCAEFASIRAVLKDIVLGSQKIDPIFKNVLAEDDLSVCDDYIQPSAAASIDAKIRVKYLSSSVICIDIIGKDKDSYKLIPFVYEIKDKMRRKFKGLEVVTEYDCDSFDAIEAILSYAPLN
jgi:hypothetical protein